ncbi:unnamed protein product [Acanthoscelides obtectus]|nr:unnamed protein product [Acanthoscelides obtectus]CAK1688387.1 hypothetical protein AOBTE_LOCUS36704 [Acanthoscelides obtectus]
MNNDYDKKIYVDNSKSKPKNLLVGSMSGMQGCPLKAATSNSVRLYHVTRLDPQTDEVVLSDYLKAVAPSVKVER